MSSSPPVTNRCGASLRFVARIVHRRLVLRKARYCPKPTGRDRREAGRFTGAVTGTVPLRGFFSPENTGRIVKASALMPAASRDGRGRRGPLGAVAESPAAAAASVGNFSPAPLHPEGAGEEYVVFKVDVLQQVEL